MSKARIHKTGVDPVWYNTYVHLSVELYFSTTYVRYLIRHKLIHIVAYDISKQVYHCNVFVRLFILHIAKYAYILFTHCNIYLRVANTIPDLLTLARASLLRVPGCTGMPPSSGIGSTFGLCTFIIAPTHSAGYCSSYA